MYCKSPAPRALPSFGSGQASYRMPTNRRLTTFPSATIKFLRLWVVSGSCCQARNLKHSRNTSMDQNSDPWTGSLVLEVDEMRHSLARRVIRKGFSAERRILAMLAAVLPRLSPLPRSTARSSSTLGLVEAAHRIASGTHRCRATKAQRLPLRTLSSLTHDVRPPTSLTAPASAAGAFALRLDRTHVLHKRLSHTRVRSADEAVLREA